MHRSHDWSTQLSFRRLHAADAAAYQTLRLEGLRLSPRAFRSTLDEESALSLAVYAERLSSSENATIGAFVDSDLVGIGTLIRETRANTRHKGDIVGVYVTPAARGVGAARGILDYLIAHARDLGLRSLILTVSAENALARRVYERVGFVSYGHEPRAQRQNGDWLDETLMCLLLD
jgi:RimJ/RimL family protein N-acetyltransferase